MLAPICGRSHEEVLEHLGEAARRRIVEPVRDLTGRFWFTHGLIAEALREQLGIAARTRAHRRTAEILEQLYTPGGVSEGGDASRIPESHFAELAYHFGEAAITGSAGKAFAYTTRAGRYAMDVLAFEEAVKHYGRALRLLEVDGEVHSAKRAPVLVALGLAQHRAGELANSEESLRLAIEAARECGDLETLAHAALQWNELAEGAPVRSETRERALDEALSGLTGDVDELRERVARALSRERA